MLNDAPGRFSMTTGCPHRLLSSSFNGRMTMSAMPPAADALITRTVLSGNAAAGSAQVMSNARARPVRYQRFMMVDPHYDSCVLVARAIDQDVLTQTLTWQETGWC